MTKRLLAAVAALALGGSVAHAGVLDIRCGDFTAMGPGNTPSTADYFPRPLPGKLALWGSPANLDDMTFAQCFTQPDLTVGQAIRLLVAKARRGERLPDVPMEGAQ